jgi:hypothetical protein
VLSGGIRGKTIKLWDAATGALIRTFEGHSGLVYSVAFSPDGARVLSGSQDSTIKLWDAATGGLIRTFDGHSNLVWSVAFSADGARVLSGSQDATIKLWDAATGGLISTFQGHADRVSSIAFSPDGARVLSGSADTTIRIWSLATAQPLASLFGGREGQWLTITPAGFFAASREGADSLGVVQGLEFTSIGQIHQSLFNPDLVREALAGDPEGEVGEAGKFMYLDKVLESGPAPTVAITSQPAGSQSSTDLVTVQARITDKGKGVGRIEWRVNGVTAAAGTKPIGRGPDYNPTQELALDPGDNTIEVVAYNGSNLLASLPARTTIKFTGAADPIKPKLHVLAIGINAYLDKGWMPPGSYRAVAFPPLKLAVSDARGLAEALKRAGVEQYVEVKVTEALDSNATRTDLLQIIDRLSSEISARDTFVLFAAAHGTSHNSRFYLIPQDYDGGTNPDALEQRAIGQDLLQDWVANRIKAKKTVLLFDTCESGALVGGYTRSRTDVPASEAAIGRLHEATGRPVLTAAATGKPALEGYKGHGVFTWALLDAMRNGDTNNNGTIELSELVAHVQALVPRLSAELRGTGRAAVALSRPTDGGQRSVDFRQTARFGSRGEDYALMRRLQ